MNTTMNMTVDANSLTIDSEILPAAFAKYSSLARQLSNLANDDLAALYGNFKQATVGDNLSAQPWFYEFVANEKWKAWTECKGKSASQAMLDYCRVADALLGNHFGGSA